MVLNLSAFLKPHKIAVFCGVVSFLVWSMPLEGIFSVGYKIKSDFSLLGVFLISNWYFLIFSCFWLGNRLGYARSANFALGKQFSVLSPFCYLAFTILALVGVSMTYYKVLSSLGLVGAMAFIVSGLANELKESLYQEYSAGIVSLRYLVAYSASLAIYRLVILRRIGFFDLLNFLLLIFSALLSSRLIFIATFCFFIFLYANLMPAIKFKPIKLAVIFALIFIVLGLLNHSRNSNYYESSGFGFWGAAISSVVAYVGSPFQVMLGSTLNIDYVLEMGDDSARDVVDIDETLNTNSSFVQLHEKYGVYAWMYVGVICLLFGALFGFLTGFGRTILLLPAAAIIYGAAELWRLDLFSQGIFLVWVAFGVIVPIIGLFLNFLFLRRVIVDNKHF